MYFLFIYDYKRLKASDYIDRETKLIQTTDSSCPSVTNFIECLENCILTGNEFTVNVTIYDEGLVLEFIIPLE